MPDDDLRALALRADLRDAEIPEFRAAPPRDHDIRGLQVAMHDIRFMDDFEAARDIERNGDRALHRQVADLIEQRAQIRAVHIFHHEIGILVRGQSPSRRR